VGGLARRFVLAFYCAASSLTVGPTDIPDRVIKETLFGLFGREFRVDIGSGWLLCVYILVFVPLLYYLYKKGRTEFSSPFYNLLIVDLDGCLLNSRREFSPKTKSQVEFLKKKRVKVILATGRAALSLQPMAMEAGLPGWHVVAHGAAIHNVENNDTEDLNTISKEGMRRIAHIAATCGVPWVAFGKKQLYCTEEQKNAVSKQLAVRGDAPADKQRIKPLSDISSYGWEEPIQKVLFYSGAEKRENVDRLLREHLHSLVRVMSTTNETVEIVHKHASKVTALKQILKTTPKKRWTSLALGDYENDEELLRWADHAAAPLNALQKIRDMKNVDAFDKSNDDDFFGEVIRTYYEFDDQPFTGKPEMERLPEPTVTGS
jgi:Cof subfamily protein (haloacid dehalogenase superfamily)